MRPATTGLATAFFRLFLLEALSAGPARPGTLLAKVAAEELPLATGGFSRALQALLEGGYVVPAPAGAVALTVLGASERVAERERWQRVIPSAARLAGEADVTPRPEPAVAEAAPPAYRSALVAEMYLDRVLLGALRERVATAREGGRPFAIALAVADVEAASDATRRAMVHRLLRATLGGGATTFGGDTNAYRYGDAGVAVIAPLVGETDRAALLVSLLRTRMEELLRAMTASVRAFRGARWRVSAGGATWTASIATSGDILRLAQDSLSRDAVIGRAA